MKKDADKAGQDARTLGRRDFIRGVAAVVAAAEVGQGAAGAQTGPKTPPQPLNRAEVKAKAPFVGIQMSPKSMLDEGIEHVLDFIKDTAAVNAVFCSSHSFGGGGGRPRSWIATDHGVPPRTSENRRLPSIWVKQHDEYFKNTVLRHRPNDKGVEYADRDLFAEMIEPARKRGMKVYARILEAYGKGPAQRILNYEKGVTIDVFGRPTLIHCWNNPDVREFWVATAEDLFRTYDLDGFQWGAERMGPLMNVLMPWNEFPPTCFCEHCRARGKARGVDPERARQGFEKLYVFAQSMIAGKPKPAEGQFTMFMRILIQYPEILSWEYLYRQGRESVLKAMYEKIKSFKPQAEVGWHVDHQPSSWDIVYRAEMSYEEMAPYSDFIKFIAYHDVLGPRIRWWYLERLRSTVLGELPLEHSLALYYDIFGYDPKMEPKLEELDKKGFSLDYVYRETKRSVASAAGKTKIYPGIGFDVPWEQNHLPADPEKVYEAVIKAYEAGADGIVVSREYEEMRLANLQAVGRAVREIFKV